MNMKWMELPLILLVLLGFPLSQWDQAIDYDWLACENSITTKLEGTDLFTDESLCLETDREFPFLSKSRLPFQFKNPLSALTLYFRGSSPFWRPPPPLEP